MRRTAPVEQRSAGALTGMPVAFVNRVALEQFM